jgi:hypothetical protein
LDKIEDEVERYFGGLYTRIFEHDSGFPGFDDLGTSLNPSPIYS